MHSSTIRPRLLVAVAALTAGLSAFAQRAPLFPDAVYTGVNTAGLWSAANAPAGVEDDDRVVRPASPALVGIDWAVMDQVAEYTRQPGREDERKVITLMFMPLPDGTQQGFEIWEDPIVHPDLAARYPGIRTWAGVGVDDPTATLRLDLTPQGVHGQILRRDGTVYLDPYARGVTDVYQVYHRADFAAHPDKVRAEIAVLGNPPADNDTGLRASGETLRTYRLALACTGEYAQFHGGTPAAALGAMVTTMNRVNGIYERDFSVRMEFIADNDLLIFLDPGSDPYTNNNGSAMLGQNQNTIDAVIGPAGYDVGHVFSTGGGGIASLGSVCDNGQKARGVTGLPMPTGDPFDVDYVSHELGHQFRGEHSWNYCGGPFGTGSTDFEPGGGSTIMGYAGLCGSDDYATQSDDYFHGGNLSQMVNFVISGTGSTCGVTTPTGNDAPVISAVPEGFTIPVSTPFYLTAEASDAQNDPITYCWEQIDGLNNLSLTNTPSGVFGVPLFRTFPPTEEPTRFFPSVDLVLDGANSRVEYLPDYTRPMRFQVSVRDNRPGGGGLSWEQTTVQVDDAAGPFAVTEPAGAGIVWEVGNWYPVSWDVAGTDVAPFDCATVRIEMSTDGGYTWDHVLAAEVPNNGGNVVYVPDAESNTVRVRVACNENIFYNVNDEDLQVVDNGTVSGLPSAEGPGLGLFPNPAARAVRVQVGPRAAGAADLTLRVVDATGVVRQSRVLRHPGGAFTADLDVAALAPGLYAVLLDGPAGREAQATLVVQR